MTTLGRLLARLTNTRPGETSVALLMFAYSFLAMTAHNILKPVIKSKIIDDLGAENLPPILLLSSILIGLLMHTYGTAARRLPRRHVIPMTQGALIVVILVLWALLRAGDTWVSVALYLFGQFFGILLISQFWVLANDIYDARQAKRLFGFIGGGACLGGALGGGIVAGLAPVVGQENLLLPSAAALGCCAAIVTRITSRLDPGQPLTIEEGTGVGTLEALRILRESRHLRILALVIACAAAGATIVEQQVAMAADATRHGDAIAVLLGQIGVVLSLAGFVLQIALTSRIHRSFGIALALILLPVAFAGSATVILLTGAVWAAAAARVLDATLRYSLDKTTREVLFLPMPADLRFKAKPVIDVTVEKLAKAGAAIVLLVLIHPLGLGLGWQRLSIATLIMTAAWIAVALSARREYLRAFRASIGTRAIEPEAIRTDMADPASIAAFVEELGSTDETAVLYAIDMLEALDRPNLIPPLLLQHPSPRVRARALRALALTGGEGAARWLPTIEGLVQDEDVDVRAAALRAIAELAHEDALALMRRHLHDPEPRVVVTAAIGLADSPLPEDVNEAEAALAGLALDLRDAGTPGRAEVAGALKNVPDPRFRPLLVPLLLDHDPTVARRAIVSARAMGGEDGLFVPGLLALLRHRSLKLDARETLVGYGSAVVPVLAHVVADPREHLWIRRHVPGALARIGGEAARDALLAVLDERDGVLRHEAVAALERLLREEPGLSCPRQVLEGAIVRETSRYYNGLTLRQNLVQHVAGGGDTLVARAIDDALRQVLDRILRLLGLIYRVDDISAARQAIEHGPSRQRAAAVEYLDNLLGGVVRKRVMPILDDAPLAEKARHANAVLKSHPRDLDDTLAQLVHDDESAIAASAVHLVASRGMWALVDDLQFVATHRAAEDAVSAEAAVWALAVRDGRAPVDSLPTVEIVDRLRRSQPFASLAVEELYHVAAAGEEIRHPDGRELYRAGQAADGVFCLLKGTLLVSGAPGGIRQVHAPAVLHVEETLADVPLTHGVAAAGATIGFRIPGAAFLTMISDSPLLAEQLCARLLASVPVPPYLPATAFAGPVAPPTATPTDVARLLRRDRLLTAAPAAHLLALAATGRGAPIEAGVVLAGPDRSPAFVLVLEGEIEIEGQATAPVTAGAGTSIGLLASLAGRAPAGSVRVTVAGKALRWNQDDLFAVLADRIDFLQAVLRHALALRDAGAADSAAGTEPNSPTIGASLI